MEQNICRSYQGLVIVVVGEPILVGNENHIIRNMTFVGSGQLHRCAGRLNAAYYVHRHYKERENILESVSVKGT